MVDRGEDDPAFHLMTGPFPNRLVMDDMSALQAELHGEITAWVDEIDRAPLVAMPDGTVSQGTFGIDREAPDPGLENRSWAWPAAMEFIGFDDEAFKTSERFYHLAYTHLMSRYSQDLDEFA